MRGSAFWQGTASGAGRLILDGFEFPPVAKAGFHLGQVSARLEAAPFQGETCQKRKRVKGETWQFVLQGLL